MYSIAPLFYSGAICCFRKHLVLIMKIFSRMHWRKASLSTATVLGVYCFVAPSRPASAQVQNYLNMAQEEIKFFVGGSGTKAGNPTFGSTWSNSTMLSPPIGMINAIGQSALHKKILLHQRIDPNGFGPATATSTTISSTASTQGSFKILALRRTNHPTGTTRVVIDLSAIATGFAKTNNLNSPEYYPPDIPSGSTYSHTLGAWIGPQPGPNDPVNATAWKRQLATIDWSTATLEPGETDIYSVEITTLELGGSTTAQFSNINGYPQVNVSATPALDNRSVSLFRPGAAGETFAVENGVPTTRGHSIYSYKWLERVPVGEQEFEDVERIEKNIPQFVSKFHGNWDHTHFQDSNNVLRDHPGDYNTESWSPTNTPGLPDHKIYPVTSHTVPLPSGAEWVDTEAVPMHEQEMPVGNPVKQIDTKWKGAATGHSQKIVNFSIDDTDGATSSAKYILNLHDPYEWDSTPFQTSANPLWDSFQPIEIIQDNAAWNSSLVAKFQFDNYYFGVTEQAVRQGSTALGVIIAGNPAGSVPGAGVLLLAQLIGVSIDTYKPTLTQQMSADFMTSWEGPSTPISPEADSKWLDANGDPMPRPKNSNGTVDFSLVTTYKFCEPELVVGYNIKAYQGEHYDKNGKVDDVEFWTREKTGAEWMIGTFKPNAANSPQQPEEEEDNQNNGSGNES